MDGDGINSELFLEYFPQMASEEEEFFFELEFGISFFEFEEEEKLELEELVGLVLGGALAGALAVVLELALRYTRYHPNVLYFPKILII